LGEAYQGFADLTQTVVPEPSPAVPAIRSYQILMLFYLTDCPPSLTSQLASLGSNIQLSKR